MKVAGLLLLVASVLASVRADCLDGSCMCDTDVGRIDLTSIVQPGSFSYTASEGDFDYYYNLCGYSVNFGSCPYNTAICQVKSADSETAFSTGAVYTEKIVAEGSNIIIQYTDGDDDRISQVKLTCDESYEYGSFTFLGEFETKVYDFELKSKCACPNKCGSSGEPTEPRPTDPDNPNGPNEGGSSGSGTPVGEIGIVLMAVSLVAIVTYFVVGGILMHFKFGHRGKEVIPQGNLWFALPGLVKDGFVFTFNPLVQVIKRLINKEKGYSPVS